MSGIAANIRCQNPGWTKDQVIAMLRRDAYKSNEFTDNAQGRNERTGRGIVQPGKTMKENIFPEIRNPIDKKEGKYYFTVTNWPAAYTITGPGISKDDKGWYADLSLLQPGTYTYIFTGKCNYEGKIYDIPIRRQLTVKGDPSPVVQIELPQVKIYPNPVSRRLTIEIPAGGVGTEARIFNPTGQQMVVHALLPGINHLDLSALKPGVYLLQIGAPAGLVHVQKVVVK